MISRNQCPVFSTKSGESFKLEVLSEWISQENPCLGSWLWEISANLIFSTGDQPAPGVCLDRPVRHSCNFHNGAPAQHPHTITQYPFISHVQPWSLPASLTSPAEFPEQYFTEYRLLCPPSSFSRLCNSLVPTNYVRLARGWLGYLNS